MASYHAGLQMKHSSVKVREQRSTHPQIPFPRADMAVLTQLHSPEHVLKPTLPLPQVTAPLSLSWHEISLLLYFGLFCVHSAKFFFLTAAIPISQSHDIHNIPIALFLHAEHMPKWFSNSLYVAFWKIDRQGLSENLCCYLLIQFLTIFWSWKRIENPYYMSKTPLLSFSSALFFKWYQ